jgi:glycosyltransferase involved in cell wall biosynthesis
MFRTSSAKYCEKKAESMRRLLWFSHFVPFPPAGGVLQRGFGLLTGLAKHFEIHLLALNQPRLVRQTAGDHSGALDCLVAQLRPYCASIRVVGIPAESGRSGRARAAARALFSRRSYTETWLEGSAIGAQLSLTSRAVRPDLMHFDTISLAPYIRNKDQGVAASLGHHNIESQMMRRRAIREHNLLKSRLLSFESARILQLERAYAHSFDLHVVCSPVDAKRLRRLTDAREIHVAENGVLGPEVEESQLSSDAVFASSAGRLLFVGRMSAYTNRDAAEYLAREIWPEITRHHPNVRLDIAGSGPPAAVTDLAASDPRVKSWGFVPDLSSILVPGSIFICPVRDGGGTKLKILDAMNRGLPIVAHPLALEGIKVVKDQHVLVARTPAEFAAETLRLLNSQPLRKALASAAFQHVREQYAFTEISRNLATRYSDVIERKRAST